MVNNKALTSVLSSFFLALKIVFIDLGLTDNFNSFDNYSN